MALYRFKCLSDDPDMSAVAHADHPDDAAAVAWAERLLSDLPNGAGFELSQQDRLVHRRPPCGRDLGVGPLRRPLASSRHCKAARALLRWTQAALAAKAGVTRKTVQDLEAGKRVLHIRTRREITAALETAGIVFIRGGPSSGEGVQLRGAPPGISRAGDSDGINVA